MNQILSSIYIHNWDKRCHNDRNKTRQELNTSMTIRHKQNNNDGKATMSQP